MATFKPVVQKMRANKTYLVYIRVIQLKMKTYIKTGMYIYESNVKDGEIIDSDVLAKCYATIKEYNDNLNRINADTSKWSLERIMQILTQNDDEISFDSFCSEYINNLINQNREITAEGYKSALTSFQRYFKRTTNFNDIRSIDLIDWIDSMKDTQRVKENYPKAIKAMFVASCRKYNDYENGIIRIKTQPFANVKIPKHDLPKKRSISAQYIQMILASNPTLEQAEKARDVAKIMIYFAGINTVDIFKMKKSNVVDGKLCYERSKTRGKRRDKAYIEICIHPGIFELMTKYNNGDKLWDFGYRDERGFNQYMNKGLKKLCKSLNIPDVDTYTFRHSWATIAYNNCGISKETIALCLNHRSAHVVTEGYIKVDFSIIDDVVDAVVKYIVETDHSKTETKIKKAKVKFAF